MKTMKHALGFLALCIFVALCTIAIVDTFKELSELDKTIERVNVQERKISEYELQLRELDKKARYMTSFDQIKKTTGE